MKGSILSRRSARGPKLGPGEIADITLLLEGTYPFVSGGVSSWVHQIIRGLSEIKFHLLDITSSDSIKTLASDLKQAHSDGIDFVINNAGIAMDGFGKSPVSPNPNYMQ